MARPDAPVERARPEGASIRRSLASRMAGLVLLVTGLLAAGVNVLIVQPAIGDFAERRLRLAGELVRTRVALPLEDIAGDIEVERERARLGLFSLDDLDKFNAEFMPYVRRTRLVSSVLLAREDGREFLLLRLPDGTWVNRVTDPPARPGMIHRITRGDEGRVISEKLESNPYDPRTRPWFRGAMGLADPRALHWTEPYVFFTTKEPGITVSLRWRGADNRTYVLAFDVLLRDLTAIVQSNMVSPHGLTGILTDDGRVLAMPAAQDLDPATAKAALLKPVGEAGIPPFARAAARWRDDGRKDGALLAMQHDAAPWFVVSQRHGLGEVALWIFTLAPVSDFAPSATLRWGAILLPALLVLLLGLWMADRLARRIGEPLERLAAESERIGNLDFTEAPVPPGSWREFNRLAVAQAHMRDLLRESTEQVAETRRGLEERVAARTRELEAANRELAAFSYSVSHDLRAPLRAINGFAGIIEEEHAASLNADGRALLGRVRGASERMGALIDSLLRLAQMSTRTLAPEDVDLSALASEIAAELRREQPEPAVRVSIEAGLRARADPALLRDVLDNLLDNAWKYCRKAEAPEIVLGAATTESGERAYFVRDNGVGFDLAYAGKLFQPFQRFHNERDFPGTGIGLATVRRIVEFHGGRVWAEARPGEGATFWFTLGADGAPAPG